MIAIRVVRLERSGAETDLGELRFAELGAPPAVVRNTPDGAAVLADVRAALSCLAPETLRAVRERVRETSLAEAIADIRAAARRELDS